MALFADARSLGPEGAEANGDAFLFAGQGRETGPAEGATEHVGGGAEEALVAHAILGEREGEGRSAHGYADVDAVAKKVIHHRLSVDSPGRDAPFWRLGPSIEVNGLGRVAHEGRHVAWVRMPRRGDGGGCATSGQDESGGKDGSHPITVTPFRPARSGNCGQVSPW